MQTSRKINIIAKLANSWNKRAREVVFCWFDGEDDGEYNGVSLVEIFKLITMYMYTAKCVDGAMLLAREYMIEKMFHLLIIADTA